jgi:tripartite-type tricarboxylate transporter receptor subunit TctC
MSGQVNSIFVDLPPSLALIRSGNVRVLAVAAPERLAVLPDVPTMAEAGLEGFEANAWQVLVGPDKMPANIVSILSKQLIAAQNDPDTRKKLEELGIIPLVMTPDVLTKFVRSEQKLWAEVIKAAGIKPQD